MIRSRHYTKAHETFRGSIRRFLEMELAPTWQRIQELGYLPREWWLRAGECGFLCTRVSTEYGGGGGDLYHSQVLIEEQTRLCMTDLPLHLHSDIVAPLVEAYGTSEQKSRYLPGMSRGEIVAALAVTEQDDAGELNSIRTSAVAGPDGYVLNGRKTFVGNGLVANLFCVVARTRFSGGTDDISLLLLEPEGAAGLTRSGLLRKVGLPAQGTVTLQFDDVRIPSGNLLGSAQGMGFSQLTARLLEERLIMCMADTANMEFAIDETARYARERKVFGQRLIDLQNSRFKLAECRTKATLARAFLEHCADSAIDGLLDPEQCAMAKWWISQRAHEVIDECVQLHGGYGYMKEYPIARRYADQRLSLIAGGTNEFLKHLIERSI